jgi:antirestriction protein ArdC
MDKKSVYDIVTEKVLESLAAGTLPWRKPWVGGAMRPINAVSGRAYNGGNLFLLSMLPYATPAFLTFNQIKAAGATIIAGQEKKYVPVFYWKWLEKKDAKGKVDKFPMLRYFLVWNIEQVDGFTLSEKFKPVDGEFKHDSIESAEAIVRGFKDKPSMIVTKTNRACYCPADDTVRVPTMEQYENVEEFYSTLFHELGHSTGHKSRLNRTEGMENISFGSHDYSCEELVAELTAAFLCMEAGLDNTMPNSAAYIASWYKKLADDPKLFWTAAGKAQKAADLILNRVKEWEPSDS